MLADCFRQFEILFCSGRHCAFDLVVGPGESLLVLLSHSVADDRGGNNAARGKQLYRAAAGIVMVHVASATFLHLQTRLYVAGRLN